MKIENHIGKIVAGVVIASSCYVGNALYNYNQLNKYGEKNVELNSEVFKKNVIVHNKTEWETKNMSPRQAYERWKAVNDSLDWEQAKALSQRVQDGTLREKIKVQIAAMAPKQAVKTLQQTLDSLERVKF